MGRRLTTKPDIRPNGKSMRVHFAALAAIVFTLSACSGKQAPPTSPSPPAAGSKVSLDTLAPGQGEAAPPAPAPPSVSQVAAKTDGSPTAEPEPLNWFGRKTPAEKEEIMEGWLHQYNMGPQANKPAILKQIQTTKLTETDKAMLERLRQRFKYPPLPPQ
jgi:hypothetical protein